MHSKMLFAVATVITKILNFFYDDEVSEISIASDDSKIWSVEDPIKDESEQ